MNHKNGDFPSTDFINKFSLSYQEYTNSLVNVDLFYTNFNILSGMAIECIKLNPFTVLMNSLGKVIALP